MQATSTPTNSPISKKEYPYMSSSNASSVQKLSFRNRHFSRSSQSLLVEKPGKKRVRNYLATLSWNKILRNNHDIPVSADDEKILLQNEKIWCLLDSEPAIATVDMASEIEEALTPLRDENGMVDGELSVAERELKRREFPSSEYSEWGGNIFEDETQLNIDDTQDSSNTENNYESAESIISANTSYNYHVQSLATGVPIYKTKSKFNETFQRHFNKFHKKFQDMYDNYQKKRSSKSNKSKDSNANSGGSNDSSNFDNLPPDAFTCYNQFRTQNFNEFFERYSKDYSSDQSNGTPTNDNIPVISSINELTYEKLKDLQSQLFNISPFSSSSNLELNVLEEPVADASPAKNVCEINDDDLLEALTEESSPCIGIFDPENNELIDVAEEQEKSKEESNGDDDDDDDYIDNEVPIGANSNQATPDIIRQLFHSSSKLHRSSDRMVENYQRYPLGDSPSVPGSSEGSARSESSQEAESTEESKDEDNIFVTDFDHPLDHSEGNASSAAQLKPTNISADTFSSFGAEPLTPRSVLKRVRSVFGRNSSASNSAQSNDQVGTRSSSDNSSNYTPVSVMVPASKPKGFLNNLAGNIYDGVPVSAVYHESEIGSALSGHQKGGFDVRNPNRFFSASSDGSCSSASSSALKRSRTPSFDLMTTIKFDKFAQILLYDGSKKLKYFTDNTRSVKRQGTFFQPRNGQTLNSLSLQHELAQQKRNSKMRQDMFKNNGTLVLGSSNVNDSLNKLRNIKLSKFSKFSGTSSLSSSNGKRKASLLEAMFEEEEQQSEQNENTNPVEFGYVCSDEQQQQQQHQQQQDEEIDTNLTINTVRSILKSRHNRNLDTETMRAQYCDDVDVKDFMEFLENHERKKMENEPYLERIREQQLLTYYGAGGEDEEGSSTSATGTTSSDNEFQ